MDTGELRDQDRFLPIANVARIMKKAIPTQVSKNKNASKCIMLQFWCRVVELMFRV